jgi:ribosomal-protein-alanine N-acetyltransferase
MRLDFPDKLEYAPVRLRRLRMDDADYFFEHYMRDPEVVKYLRWKPHSRMQETIEFIQKRVLMREQGSGCYWAITVREDRPIGLIGLRMQDLPVSLGFGLSRQFWGQGHMSAAVQCILNWAWQQREIERVSASCDSENHGSMGVLAKAGFQRTGIKKSIRPNLSDKPRDSYTYLITKPRISYGTSN